MQLYLQVDVLLRNLNSPKTIHFENTCPILKTPATANTMHLKMHHIRKFWNFTNMEYEGQTNKPVNKKRAGYFGTAAAISAQDETVFVSLSLCKYSNI